MKYTKEETARSLETLRETLSPGDTVYCVLRHCARSGMSRSIDLYVIQDNRLATITYSAARVLGDVIDNVNGGIKVSGCGMDMGFHLVYSLARQLWPEGFGIAGEMPLGHAIRPKSQASAARAVAKGAKFYGRNGDSSGWDGDGGYALSSRWV